MGIIIILIILIGSLVALGVAAMYWGKDTTDAATGSQWRNL